MNKQSFIYGLSCLFLSVSLLSCSSDDNEADVDTQKLKAEIISFTAQEVCETAYIDMYAKSEALLASVKTLNTETTDANLQASRDLWKAVRSTWEKTEAWLFGPISADNIDPRIDTWPIEKNAFEAILAGNDELTATYVNGLEDALKGFHPIELLLWGENGDKTAAEFTPREKEFLLALTTNLNTLAESVKSSWVNGYTMQLATAGKGSESFSTQKAALVQLVDAMAGICDEVANGKIAEPFTQQDPTKLESPFAKNSLVDFTNNVKGVMIVYKANFAKDGKGIEDFVRLYNLQLDNKIKNAHLAAITALESIDVSFSEAIISQGQKVQNAMDKINALKTILEGELRPFIIQYANK